ncbi:sigma-70 family RNA polymerase sigma factor [Parapedobacter sp.]
MRKGNTKAFEDLYFAYSKRLYGNILKMVKSTVVAEEILQDVFQRIWERRESIDADKSFKSFLFTIAKHLVCDFFYRQTRERDMEAYLIGTSSELYQHIDEELAYKECETILSAAIDRLPLQRRKVYTLCKIEGRSYEEVGKILGISTSAISDHIVKATKSLKLHYRELHIISLLLALDATLLKVAEGRDPRLAQTIQINDKQHYRWQQASPPVYFIAPAFDGWDSEESCPTGYQIYKGHNFRYADARAAGQGLQALIYFRFGEVMLIYAEAKAELGTLTQADLDRSINKLRERAGGGLAHLTMDVAVDPNFEFANLSPIIQAVRRERKVELACEGFRVDDIMRWAAADELIVGEIPLGAKKAQFVNFNFSDYLPESQPDLSRQDKFAERVAQLEVNANGYIKIFKNTLNGGAEGFKFDVNRDYLYPIPTNQLTLNPQLGQNPGWVD